MANPFETMIMRMVPHQRAQRQLQDQAALEQGFGIGRQDVDSILAGRTADHQQRMQQAQATGQQAQSLGQPQPQFDNARYNEMAALGAGASQIVQQNQERARSEAEADATLGHTRDMEKTGAIIASREAEGHHRRQSDYRLEMIRGALARDRAKILAAAGIKKAGMYRPYNAPPDRPKYSAEWAVVEKAAMLLQGARAKSMTGSGEYEELVQQYENQYQLALDAFYEKYPGARKEQPQPSGGGAVGQGTVLRPDPTNPPLGPGTGPAPTAPGPWRPGQSTGMDINDESLWDFPVVP